ncbi:uncharacterized protein LOC141901867 [Tubulanus polymorphus]|uniref:uncharacterized protein LOC141901867 n=1 Tax=Tubulanus polymorphus TaxID=672921 RepID=UPI003DA6C764
MMSSDDGDKNHTLSLVEYMSNYMKSKVKPNWESKTIENEGVDRDDMTNYLESNGIRGERLKKALEFFANDSSKSDNLVSFSAIERYLNVDIPEIVGEFCARYQKAKNEPAASK